MITRIDVYLIAYLIANFFFLWRGHISFDTAWMTAVILVVGNFIIQRLDRKSKVVDEISGEVLQEINDCFTNVLP